MEPDPRNYPLWFRFLPRFRDQGRRADGCGRKRRGLVRAYRRQARERFPNLDFGGRIEGRLGPLELGVQAKRTGSRYVFDTNLPVMESATSDVEVFSAKAPAYTLVDLDIRLSLADYGLERSYLQFNVTNLFDELYVGGFNGGLYQSGSPPFVQIGAPRTISGTFVIGF